MKHLFKTLAVALAATLTLASCSKDDDMDVTTTDQKAAAIAEQFVDHTVGATRTIVHNVVGQNRRFAVNLVFGLDDVIDVHSPDYLMNLRKAS